MTVYAVCAVRDSAVNSFMQPMFAPHVGAVMRSFQDEVRRAESPMNAHREDYELYEIARFDDQTGMIVPLDQPRQLLRGTDVQ